MSFDPSAFLHGILQSLKWFALCFVLFSLLGRYFACNQGQKLWTRESANNAFYWLVPPLFYGYAFQLMAVGVLLLAFDFDPDRVRKFALEGGAPSHLPLWLQVALILVVSDCIQYWLHRGFHGARLWKFHAIHHAQEHVDWATSVRFHPVNYLLYATTTAVATVLMGFSTEAFVLLQPFNILYSCMVHANLNWTFGPLRYVFASPVFHRWHHTSADEGGNKNFAPTFPVLDLIFGTFYMPKGKLPEVYGITGNPVPESILGQMAYPFRK